MSIVLSSLSAIVLALALGGTPQQSSTPSGSGEQSQPSSPGAVQAEPVDLPVDVDKIQRALSRPAALKTTTTRPVFRVEVFARKPTVADILGPDYLIGPVPYGGMTHQEFLNMVTPTEYRGYSMFTNKEGMMVAASSLVLQWALMKAVDKLKDARDERAKEAARREVLAAMNELEAARKKAGLTPK